MMQAAIASSQADDIPVQRRGFDAVLRAAATKVAERRRARADQGAQ